MDNTPIPQSTVTTNPTTPVSIPQNTPQERKSSKMKYAVLLGTIIVLIIAAVLSYILTKQSPKTQSQVTVSPETQKPAFTFKGKVEYASGNVWKIVNDRKTEIKENDTLSETDRVVTDTKGRLVITFDDGSVIRIDENSDITLDALKPENMTIKEEKGILFARVNKDESHLFSVKAGPVTVTSMGTVFSVEKKEEVKVSVYDSKVGVTKEGSEKTEVTKNQQWQEKTAKTTTLSSNETNKNEFLSWSLKEEKIETVTKAPPPQTGLITLLGKTTDKGIALSWESNNIDVSKGYKIVKNTTGTPKYPGDAAVLVSANTRSYTWEISGGQTWHVRVCQYRDGSCGVYSNEITVTAPETTESKKSESPASTVKSITQTIQKEGNKAKITWTVDGSSEKGFKVVWSQNNGPAYPTRDGDSFHYLSDAGARSNTVEGLESGKTYYFRVCEYLGGKCGTYSNETSLTF